MNILIVDDIVINRFILKEIVRKMGLTYFEAENGLKACELFENNDIRLVLLDIEMPVMNGLETAAKLRKIAGISNKKIFLYAITAYHRDILEEEVNMSDFDGIISKPFSEEKIRNLIESIKAT